MKPRWLCWQHSCITGSTSSSSSSRDSSISSTNFIIIIIINIHKVLVIIIITRFLQYTIMSSAVITLSTDRQCSSTTTADQTQFSASNTPEPVTHLSQWHTWASSHTWASLDSRSSVGRVFISSDSKTRDAQMSGGVNSWLTCSSRLTNAWHNRYTSHICSSSRSQHTRPRWSHLSLLTS